MRILKNKFYSNTSFLERLSTEPGARNIFFDNKIVDGLSAKITSECGQERVVDPGSDTAHAAVEPRIDHKQFVVAVVNCYSV